MMKSRTPWKEKMLKPAEVRYVIAPDDMPGCVAGTSMLIATPLSVQEEVDKIPYGSVITTKELGKRLAQRFKADVACPLTTGIFLRIVAEATEESRNEGATKLTPWWRVLKEGYILNEKMPSGPDKQMGLLSNEGFSIVPKGKKNFRVVV